MQAIDPVCGMKVEIRTARYTTTYRDTTYYFCTPLCMVLFANDPERYLAKAVERAGHTSSEKGWMR